MTDDSPEENPKCENCRSVNVKVMETVESDIDGVPKTHFQCRDCPYRWTERHD